MKRHLHTIAALLFALCLLFDLVVWGAAPGLPEIGPAIQASANREAPVAAAYIWLGSYVDAALPSLGRSGEAVWQRALQPSVERIHEDSAVAMDVIFNTTNNRAHRWIKIVFNATPVLLVVSLLLWWRRPRKISLIGGRR